jgi:hypothetical protein
MAATRSLINVRLFSATTSIVVSLPVLTDGLITGQATFLRISFVAVVSNSGLR